MNVRHILKCGLNLTMAGGRPAALAYVVDPNTVLTPNQLRNESWTLRTLSPRITGGCLDWLAKRRLISNSWRCDSCHLPARFYKFSRGLDGYRWRCRACDIGWSIRQGSFFEQSHLPLDSIIALIYYWATDTPLHTVAKELAISKHSVVDWHNFCRDVCVRWCDNAQPIGGLDANGTEKVVELDESCFFRRKNHVGRMGPHQWVFGGIERGTRKCFMVLVPDRSRRTLQPIIERYVQPGINI